MYQYEYITETRSLHVQLDTPEVVLPTDCEDTFLLPN